MNPSPVIINLLALVWSQPTEVGGGGLNYRMMDFLYPLVAEFVYLALEAGYVIYRW